MPGSTRSVLPIPGARPRCPRRSDGTVVGYAGLFLTPDGGEITGLAVLPDHRARGLGRALLQTLIDEAERLGLPALRLEVRESNLPARRLYESLGFLVDGRRRRYYRRPAEDAILMSRPVGREETS